MPRAPLTTLLAVTLTALLAVGCGSDQPESAPPAPPASSQPPTEPAAEPSAVPTHEATGSTSSPTPSATPRHRGRHKVGLLAPHPRTRAKTPTAEHLLAASDLPVLAGGWTARSASDDTAVGACQKTGLGTIGAMEWAHRTYTADGASATQVVARFADTKSAWRAHEVLTAWRDDCAERLGKAVSSVGPLAEVSVPVGTGASYRAAYRKHTAGLGILRTGTYLTVVEITAEPDSYPENWEPARIAVRRIARTFGA